MPMKLHGGFPIATRIRKRNLRDWFKPWRSVLNLALEVFGRIKMILSNEDLNGDMSSCLRKERFRMMPAMDFLFEPERVRNGLGVYVILLKDADQILKRSCPSDVSEIRRWSLRGYQHVYTGMSAAVRSRLLWHLCGDNWNSSVREALLAMQF